ncbi:coiled-coil and C2 domain-containing protein 1-like isoform X2 [Aplysia californica]|uniref:Coiled-coil and C2 domain-containing protein 1-like isoform X2 n=1 Tax=Aplysia californica TaxID=6500 RepID=A0ABM1VZM8_APLCA|nr:coiled-coil and C2 domain-containing protein 1-like isoform X2 [Aplysia californica]
MFGRKPKQSGGGSGSEQGRRKGADLMNQMGFGAMPGLEDMDAMVYGDDDDDDDLEAELAALAGEDDGPVQRTKPKRKAPMPIADIEKMAAMGMNDFDEDVSDTEDPELLAELEDLKEDASPAPSPSKSPHVSPEKSTPTATPPPAPQRQAAPIFEPTLPSQAFTPSPVPRNLPSPQKAPSPSPRPSPTPVSPAAQPSGARGMVGLLEERVNMYKQASANAKASGDSSKQRRLDRGLKTLVGQLRQAKAGKPVNEEEIPPPVAMGASLAVSEHTGGSTPQSDSPQSQSEPSTSSFIAPPAPKPSSPPARPSPGGSLASNAKSAVVERRDQYRRAALQAKHAGNLDKAREYVKVSKQFDSVIDALDQGKPVDLSKMPPPPSEFAGDALNTVNKPQASVPVQRVAHQAAGETEPEPDLPATTAEEEKSMFQAPDAPRTAMEALTQRLDKYKSSESSAKAAGEGSKARRMGRIVKQYEDAIKCYRAGRPVDFEELPCPPGYAPIPVDKSPPGSAPRAPSGPAPSGAAAGRPIAQTAPAPRPAAPRAAAPPAAPAAPQAGGSGQRPPPVQRQASARKSLHSRSEQQLAFLRERLGEFRQAAMSAKKKHDLELAKKYVRMMKGLEPMIEALESGLPVDLSQVPPSPFNSDESEDKFVVVSVEDCQPTGDREEVYKSLQQDLVRQIRVCVTNAQHYQKLGDIPAAAKFQKLEQNNRRDLESLKSAFRHGDPSPRFHYETRSFSMVQCNTDLGDADLELTVIRGIQYNLPSGYSEKDMDTQVKYEFAYPTDEVQSGGTGTVKDSINPEYNETFKISINRKSKGLFRFVDRKSLKLEIFIKRSFFKGDKLHGTVNVKLQPLESQCTLHESYDLMDGRKTVGGKLEVKIRIRDPFKNKQVDEVKEKWLVIDQFIRTVGSRSQAEAKTSPKSHSLNKGNTHSFFDGTTCMEVLRYEKGMLDKQIYQLKDSLSVTQTQALRHKSALIEEKIELQQKKLREGGLEAWKAYLAVVKSEAVSFEQEARQYVRVGEVQKAELMMNKKKLAEKEIAAIKAKIPDA